MGGREPATHCRECNIELNSSNRYCKRADGSRGTNWCIDCRRKHISKYMAGRRKADENQWERGRKYALKKKYGITEEEYTELLNSQGGVCAICKFPCISGDRLCVDHDHKSGEVRGLLCKSCNIALAAVNESEDLIYSLLDYIRKYNDCPMPGIRPTQDLEK